MNSNDLLTGVIPVFALDGAAFLLAGALPFVASLLLDGIVHVFRGRGLRLFLLGTVMTVVLGVGSGLLWHWAAAQPSMTPSTISGATSLVDIFLRFSIPLALLAFVVRFFQMIGGARRRSA